MSRSTVSGCTRSRPCQTSCRSPPSGRARSRARQALSSCSSAAAAMQASKGPSTRSCSRQVVDFLAHRVRAASLGRPRHRPASSPAVRSYARARRRRPQHRAGLLLQCTTVPAAARHCRLPPRQDRRVCVRRRVLQLQLRRHTRELHTSPPRRCVLPAVQAVHEVEYVRPTAAAACRFGLSYVLHFLDLFQLASWMPGSIPCVRDNHIHVFLPRCM